jgi:hypothetical protein
MPWTVEYNSELGIVEGRYVGRVTDDDFKEATIKAIGLAKVNNTNRFFIDDSEWEGGASVLGLFQLPKMHEKLEADRTSRAALILPPSSRAAEVRDAQFYETVCKNRGWNVRVFLEREEAIKWLTSK